MSFFTDQTVLITGNGSFADAYVTQLLQTDIKEVRILSRNEKMQVETRRKFNSPKLNMIIGDIRNLYSVEKAMEGVDYVIHTAALKHIDICQKQPLEAISTNVYGSINVLMASATHGVKRVVILSTDKACNAETCYGSTKYLMERAALGMDMGGTEVVITRYGNVLGSSGSVIPLFKRLKEEGRPLTVTNPDITRFFITMETAIDLVNTALMVANDREIVTYLSKSATVGDIADAISDKQIITGVRCVEKTGEALLTVDELRHSRIIDNYAFVSKETVYDSVYDEPYTSDNAPRFSKEELEELINAC